MPRKTPRHLSLTAELVDRADLQIAACEAIRSWANEGSLANKLRQTETITEQFLSRWLGLWRLARANPLNLRTGLVQSLNESVRPRIMKSSAEELPALVSTLAAELQDGGMATGRQTSLVSKFAFSLRPEVIVPYDSTVRAALGILFGQRLKEHDYATYLAKFGESAKVISHALDDHGLVEKLRPRWSGAMSETLFRLRAADKYCMLVGGFPREKMARGCGDCCE